LLFIGSLRTSLSVPSLFLFFSINFLVLKLAHRFLGSCILSVGSLVLFLFAGGLGFLDWFKPEGHSSIDFDYVFNSGGYLSMWSHPLFHYLFAYRPAQLALALVLCLLHVLRTRLHASEFAFIGIVLGVLPAVQHQVFLGALIWLAFSVTLAEKEKQFTGPAVGLTAFAIVAAVPLLQYMPRDTTIPVCVFEPFWHQAAQRGRFFPALAVWWHSLGLFALVTIVIPWPFVDRRLLKVYIPSMAVFLFANACRFQGDPRQNIVLFYPFWMVVATIVFVDVFRGIAAVLPSEELQGIAIGAGIFVFAVSIASAIVGFANLTGLTANVWTSDALEVAEWIVANTPRDALFVASNGDFDVVCQLAGRVQVIQSDYRAWMAGFEVAHREDAVTELLETGEAEILPEVEFVVNCPEGRKRIEAGDNWEVVFAVGEYEVLQKIV
jgi:hypothetical protein